MSLDRRGDADRKDGQVNKKRDFNQSLGIFFPLFWFIYIHTHMGRGGKRGDTVRVTFPESHSSPEPRERHLQPGMLRLWGKTLAGMERAGQGALQ